MAEPMVPPEAGSALDRPRKWAIDSVMLGTLAGAMSPTLLILTEPAPTDWPSFVALLASCGAVTGALVGLPLRALLDRLRHRLSLRALGALMPAVGAAWGFTAIMGIVVALHADEGTLWSTSAARDALEVGAQLGAPFGALVFGALWLPYAVTAVMRLPRWPIALATALLSPIVGYLLVLAH